MRRGDCLAADPAALRRRQPRAAQAVRYPGGARSAGVGENLQDHLEMYLQYECKEPVSLYPALQWWNQPKIGAEWLFGGTGIGASNQFEAGGFIRSRAEFAWPNIQYHFLPVAINYNGSNAVKEHGFQCHVGSMRSPSRGHVRLKSRDPHAHPAILFNYMSHEQDWQEFRDAIRITREIMNSRRWISIAAAKSARVLTARAMPSWMSLCATTPRPHSTHAGPVRWVTTRWRWSTAKAGSTVWKACG